MRMLYLLICVPVILSAQPSAEIIPLKFVYTKGSSVYDSSSAALDIADMDTTAWVGITDSLYHTGGYAAVFFSDEDTVNAAIRIQWGTYDTKANAGAVFQQLSVMDSLVSGYHTGAIRNPVSSNLCFKRPPGATRVRFIITAGMQIGQFAPGLTAQRIPRIRGNIIRIKQ